MSLPAVLQALELLDLLSGDGGGIEQFERLQHRGKRHAPLLAGSRNHGSIPAARFSRGNTGIVRPPSITIARPVTKSKAGEQRRTTICAISPGVTRRPSGVAAIAAARYAGILSVRGPAIWLGTTAFTVMCGASSTARLSVRLKSAALASP